LDKRLLDRDPLTGVEEWFHFDPMTGDVHIETRQDVTPYIESNKAAAADPEVTRRGIKNDMWKYAQIPIWVQMKWLNEYGMNNWPMHPNNSKLLFRLLNSPEWKYLKRTEKIHVARS
jgi:hypothetical protein